MKTLSIIGYGAIAQYVAGQIGRESELRIISVITRPGREQAARDALGADIDIIFSADAFTESPDFVLDCAGHQALRQHGEAVLEQGIDLATVSVGALADDDLFSCLTASARRSGAQLSIVSGAIGALDALSAAMVGGLRKVIYKGRKPPRSWVGSPAEQALDLNNITEARVHFRGNARNAALSYPKNANVAASVALAGLGFDETEVELIADPDITENIHEITAIGEFGSFEFQIKGRALPGNPSSSALTAMSVVRESMNRVALFVA